MSFKECLDLPTWLISSAETRWNRGLEAPGSPVKVSCSLVSPEQGRFTMSLENSMLGLSLGCWVPSFFNRSKLDPLVESDAIIKKYIKTCGLVELGLSENWNWDNWEHGFTLIFYSDL